MLSNEILEWERFVNNPDHICEIWPKDNRQLYPFWPLEIDVVQPTTPIIARNVIPGLKQKLPNVGNQAYVSGLQIEIGSFVAIRADPSQTQNDEYFWIAKVKKTEKEHVIVDYYVETKNGCYIPEKKQKNQIVPINAIIYGPVKLTKKGKIFTKVLQKINRVEH